jgi:hypothetical protein
MPELLQEADALVRRFERPDEALAAKMERATTDAARRALLAAQLIFESVIDKSAAKLTEAGRRTAAQIGNQLRHERKARRFVVLLVGFAFVAGAVGGFVGARLAGSEAGRWGGGRERLEQKDGLLPSARLTRAISRMREGRPQRGGHPAVLPLTCFASDVQKKIPTEAGQVPFATISVARFEFSYREALGRHYPATLAVSTSVTAMRGVSASVCESATPIAKQSRTNCQALTSQVSRTNLGFRRGASNYRVVCFEHAPASDRRSVV